MDPELTVWSLLLLGVPSYLSDSRPKQVTFFLAQISDFGKIIPSEGIAHGWYSQEQTLEKLGAAS